MSSQPGRVLVRCALSAVVAGSMIAAFVGVGGAGSSVFAKGGHGSTGGSRPGLGCGDKNHHHTGVPGNPSKACKTTTTSTTKTGTTTTGTTTTSTTTTVSTNTDTTTG